MNVRQNGTGTAPILKAFKALANAGGTGYAGVGALVTVPVDNKKFQYQVLGTFSSGLSIYLTGYII